MCMFTVDKCFLKIPRNTNPSEPDNGFILYTLQRGQKQCGCDSWRGFVPFMTSQRDDFHHGVGTHSF